MDMITDGGPLALADGVRDALFTIFFCAAPLAFAGAWLARALTRQSSAAALVPLADAIHAFARFALVLLALNVCLVLPMTMVVALQMTTDTSAWPLWLFLLLCLTTTAIADTYGLHAWRNILGRTSQTRVLSFVAR
jgi:hypothetical protein